MAAAVPVIIGLMIVGAAERVDGAADQSWVETAGFVPIRPVRILDTRSEIGLSGPFRSPDPRTLKVTGAVPTAGGQRVAVPVGASAVALNVTVVLPTHAGFISVRPGDDRSAVQTSNLNFWRGAVIPNSVLVALAADGTLQITYDAYGVAGQSADVLVDVMGYFTRNAAVPGDGAPSTTTPGSETTTTSPGGGSVGLDDVMTISVRTGSSTSYSNEYGIVDKFRQTTGTYVFEFDRVLDECVVSATSSGDDQVGKSMLTVGVSRMIEDLSPGSPEQGTRLKIRQWNSLGQLTNGTDKDGFDLIAFCRR